MAAVGNSSTESPRGRNPRTETAREGWWSRRTTIPRAARELFDGPSVGLEAWARTTAGVVAFLVALQIWTGVLLAFFYVPSAEAAHTTVAYVEKVAAGGSWVRALHFHGSQWLPLAILLHLLQLFLRRGYERRPVAWLAAVSLLALVMANGATGYSLPWDARAFYSTRVMAGIAGGLPLVGEWARAWLTGGNDLSTLTLSRLNALHVFVVPLLILTTLLARFFVFRDRTDDGGDVSALDAEHDDESRRATFAAQLARNSVAVALVFLALAVLSSQSPAPLGPQTAQAAPGYLPRPGAQFLWLFQLLKYFPAAVASLVALLLPALLLFALASLPFLRNGTRARRLPRLTPRAVGTTAFALCLLLVTGLSLIAYTEDARDPRVREQLARQERDEAEFRAAPFTPRLTGASPQGEANNTDSGAQASTQAEAVSVAAPPPEAYVKNCAKCHGASGEGKSVNPPLVGLSARPNRTVEDVVRIIDDPRAYNLEKRMPSFAGKLSEDEKRAIAEWVVALK